MDAMDLIRCRTVLQSSPGAASPSDPPDSTAAAAARRSSDAESKDEDVDRPRDAVPEFASESVTKK